jgi:hypothetical protein
VAPTATAGAKRPPAKVSASSNGSTPAAPMAGS